MNTKSSHFLTHYMANTQCEYSRNTPTRTHKIRVPTYDQPGSDFTEIAGSTVGVANML